MLISLNGEGHAEDNPMISKIADQITLISEADPGFDLFEARYPIPEGITYNTYVIEDEKTVLLDAVDAKVTDEWVSDLKKVLNGRKLDYFVVHHMEPDHSANIGTVLSMFPDVRIITSAKAVKMMSQFMNEDMSSKCDVVKEGDVLDLGKHKLHFVETMMVHWPEVIMSYEPTEGILFSADAFGRFGPYDPAYDWVKGARRYYMNIVGKFGQMVQKALAKLSPLDIKKICPLHGCVLEGDLSGYLALYDTWSSYRPETEGVAVIYASFYGNTRKAAEKICQIFKDKGVETQIVDLVHTDVSYALEAAFRYSRMIVAAPSYEGGLAPQMEAFLLDIGGKKYQSRKVGIIENGTFGPCAGKFMAKHLETMEGVEIVGPKVTIHSAMSKENEAQIEDLAANILG